MIPNPWPSIKEYFGLADHHEVVASVEMAVQDRIASPFYGYFVIGWLIFNWHIVYSSLFLNQEVLYQKTGLLRNEYIEGLSPGLDSWQFYWAYFMGPFIFAFAALWIFPYATRPFFRKSLKNKVQLRIIELQELRKEKREEVALSKEETALLQSKAARVQAEKIVASENPEVLWEQEFQKLRKNQVEYWRLTTLRDKVYADNGYIYAKDRQAFAYFHATGLVEFEPDQNHIQLTKKGMYFIRRYVETLGETQDIVKNLT